MSEVFRISERSLRSRRKGVAFVVAVVLMVVIVQACKTTQSLAQSAAIGVTLLVIAIVISLRQYRQYASFARIHTLTMHGEYLLFRDADTESRVPYSSIERVALDGMLGKVNLIRIKCRDLPEQQLHGYENFPRLIEQLLQKVPHASVCTRGIFMSRSSA